MATRIDLLKQGAHFLAQEGITNASGETELTLSHLLQCQRLDLYLDNLPMEKNNFRHFWEILSTRAKGLPLQYLLGSVEFMGLNFKVGPGVFIPRPETEILVETAINILTNEPTNQRTNEQTILDLGTGCGNIAVSLAAYLKKAHIFACDISDFALQLAKGNFSLNKVDISLVKSDLFTAFKELPLFSLIVSNPPYICAGHISELAREVHYEPREAYDGGKDGLFYYRRIIKEAPAYLQAQGLLAMELGDNQADAVKEILRQNGKFSLVSVVRDYNDVERVILARKSDG